MRARTMLSLPSWASKTQEECEVDASGPLLPADASASTILLGVTALLPIVLLFPLVALCVHTEEGDAWKFLWWATWLGLLVAALACVAAVWSGSFRQLPRRPATRGLASAYVVAQAALLLASMWLLADYSHAYLAEADAREVVDVRVDKLGEVTTQDGVAMVALRRGEGYIPQGGSATSNSSLNSMLITNFNYGCHGELVLKMCCDVGVMPAGSQCRNCSYWKYPDVCPGAELFVVAPLWLDQGSGGGRPAAIVYQSSAFLFETEAARSAWVLTQQASPPPFTSEYCRGGRLCAFVPRNVHVQAHWDHWHRGDAAKVEQAGVGAHSYEGLPAGDSLLRAQGLAAVQMQVLGRPGELVPLLWVPADTHASFARWEGELSDSERRGEVGRAILYVAAGLFGFAALGAAAWTHGRACFEASGSRSEAAAHGDGGAEPTAKASGSRSEAAAQGDGGAELTVTV